MSLEAGIAFIQDCDFDSGDEDHDHDHEGSLVRLLQQRSHQIPPAASAGGAGASGCIGRQPQQTTTHALNQQRQPPRVHPQQGGHPLFTSAASSRAFGLQTQGARADFPSVHGLSSGTSEDEQTPISTTTTRASGSGSAKRGKPSSAAATAKGKQGASSTSSPAPSSLRDTELDKRFRGRHKDKLIYLREKMEEFQTQLDQLKKAARSRSAQSQPTAAGAEEESPMGGEQQEANDETSEEVRSPSMWEMLATRQSEERRKVEEENAKLKSALEKQIRMAKSLEKILRKRTSATLLQSQAPASKRPKHFRSGSLEGIGNGNSNARDDADFHEMLASMEELYWRFDYSVFHTLHQANGGATDPAVPILEANVKCDDVNGIFVESLDSWTVPFEFETVKRVMWCFLSEQGAKYHTYHQEKAHLYLTAGVCDLKQHVDVTEDSIVRNYVVEIDEAGGKATINGKQTVRRYMEENRCVTVWRSLFKPLGGSTSGGGGARRMALRESGWCMITRGATANVPALGSVGLPSTLIQSCSYILPVLAEDATDDSYKVGALTDFAVSSREESIKAYHQALENLLLAESMKA